jgi:recombination protein RecA
VFYGEKTVTPGGKALKFFASVRLNVAKGEKLTGKGDEQVGTVLKITATKNKVAPPWRSGTVNLYFGSGIDLVVDAFDAGVDRKVIAKEGNTYSFGETKIGVGRDASVEFLRENKDVYENVRKQILAVIKEQK